MQYRPYPSRLLRLSVVAEATICSVGALRSLVTHEKLQPRHGVSAKYDAYRFLVPANSKMTSQC